MKYAIEMGSGAMVYIPNFIKIDRLDTQTYRQQGDLISLLLFVQYKWAKTYTSVRTSGLRFSCSFHFTMVLFHESRFLKKYISFPK
jgi:hypothetical protein